MVPWSTWNTLFSLLVPFATMALVAKAGRRMWEPMLTCLLAIGLFSGALGFLQAISPNNISLHFYQDTGLSSSVGVFSNRNHQGVLLASLFPMLAAFASQDSHSADQRKFRKLSAVAIGILLIPMLLVTGSRAGLVAGVVGLVSVSLIYRPHGFPLSPKRNVRRSLLPYIFGTSVVVAVVMSALAVSRDEALVRFLNSGGESEERLKIWATLPQIVYQYWPVGSGIGSFVEAYQVYEPYDRLTYLYVNHAHNELIELMITAGLPGLISAVMPLLLWVWAAWRTFQLRKSPIRSGEAVFVRLGLTILLILGLASLVDYPLRTPALSSLAIVAAIWIEIGLRRLQSGNRSAEGLVRKGSVV